MIGCTSTHPTWWSGQVAWRSRSRVNAADKGYNQLLKHSSHLMITTAKTWQWIARQVTWLGDCSCYHKYNLAIYCTTWYDTGNIVLRLVACYKNKEQCHCHKPWWPVIVWNHLMYRELCSLGAWFQVPWLNLSGLTQLELAFQELHSNLISRYK